MMPYALDATYQGDIFGTAAFWLDEAKKILKKKRPK
jgi:hypothetical protein